MIVIDTHALVWMIEGEPQLGERARALIEDELDADGVVIAPITVWEAAMLVDKNRLALSKPVGLWFSEVLAVPGFRLGELTVAIGVDAGTLPSDIHGDPADRLIIATARALSCPVLTSDGKVLDYAQGGHVEAIMAHR